MSGEELDVSQRAAGLMHEPGRAGDERPSPRMGRAAFKTDGAICPIEPVDDTDWVHRTAARRSNDRSPRIRP